MDLLVEYDNNTQQYDFVLNSEQAMLEQTKDIETLVQCALFTDRTADEYWTKSSKKGWWGESDYPQDIIGSRLWQLIYYSQTEYESYAQSFCTEALEFLAKYNMCDDYKVTCSYESSKLTVIVQVTKGTIKTDYSYVWEGV